MDTYDREHNVSPGDGDDIRDIDKTDMKTAMDCFERTFMQPMWLSIRFEF